MNNEYIEMYCDHYNLIVERSFESPGENYILENGSIVGFFRDNEKIVEFKKGTSMYRKGDLLLFLLEGDKAH